MKTTPSGKAMYIAVSHNVAIRIKSYSKPKAAITAALIFAKEISGWKPEDGGFVEKAHDKNVRRYLSEHSDLKWFNEGKPIDAYESN